MAFRIHFTFADLAKTRVSHSTYPLQELSIAMRVLRDRTPSTRFGAWRHEVLSRLPATARMAFEMTPSHGWVPDFLAPAAAGDSQELLERVRATPRRRLREEMERVAARQSVPRWSRQLGEDPSVLQRLVDSLSTVHDVLLAPYRPRVEARLEADRSLRARALLHGGMERVLSQLHPRRIRWESPVLTVDMASGMDADLRLEGQGLLLVPSFFGSDAPGIAPDTEPQPMLFYPASSDSPHPDVVRPDAGVAGPSTALAQLLGRTRAAVLLAIADRVGCTTTELSTAVGISVSNASEHATVLRRAGLITTTRHHKAVLHTVTPIGRTLLNTA
ncbi:helix-turn-helix domain-containing protein [Streptomyces sp. TRM43335]|uniref:Helix-turn-helix domain-containing protein n=1 Tax=Streptomyces taklimakanensis TaxID=2569853 RepID=A0A6G2BBV1_9ACTN|nr:winged helix-turn-helix domain-containing protein [Streptomyces taklimakanensis]MTE19738.1 helix-turn-helix domain-containing protein [Streptomyces taklimakanensis]